MWSSAAVSAVLAVAGCGTDDNTTSDSGTPSPSARASSSPQDMAFLEEALPFGSAIEPRKDVGREDLLLAIGRDWCEWRQSPDYGTVSVEQFFGELLINAADGKGIQEAAELHLCPA